ncbi:MAG: glycosyltransferase family 2 protein, partial [Pelagibacterales bacterium]|nr:glycosyltransferase family 2 protein [Pelagibacterales bacterium]
MTKPTQGISIIISAFNHEGELNNLLKQILSMNTSYKGNYEIIVIADGDDAKIDPSNKPENVHYYKREKNFGSGLSRHFGVLKSKFDIVV